MNYNCAVCKWWHIGKCAAQNGAECRIFVRVTDKDIDKLIAKRCPNA